MRETLHTLLVVAVSIATIVVMGEVWNMGIAQDPTIAGTRVSSVLECEEDEVIGFTGEGDNDIDCIHIETIRN